MCSMTGESRVSGFTQANPELFPMRRNRRRGHAGGIPEKATLGLHSRRIQPKCLQRQIENKEMAAASKQLQPDICSSQLSRFISIDSAAPPCMLINRRRVVHQVNNANVFFNCEKSFIRDIRTSREQSSNASRTMER